MQKFLKSSPVVDFGHPEVEALARDLMSEGSRDGYALRCFDCVRDNVIHSADTTSDVVSCSASEVAASRVGLCYAKSHLLVALLRAGKVPSGFSYLRVEMESGRFCLHGLVSIWIDGSGWYRVDPRGGARGAAAKYSPPLEELVYHPQVPGERDIQGVFAEPWSNVISALKNYTSMRELMLNLPDEGRD